MIASNPLPHLRWRHYRPVCAGRAGKKTGAVGAVRAPLPHFRSYPRTPCCYRLSSPSWTTCIWCPVVVLFLERGRG